MANIYLKGKIIISRTIRRHHGLYSLYKYLFDRRHYRLGARHSTRLVMEGFPRSGNSFAVIAFEFAQDQDVDIAHHWHSPSQLIYAVKHAIPAILLIREPEDAVISYAIYRGTKDLCSLFDEYIWFHRQVRPAMDGILLVKFEEVIANFGAVVEKINLRFNSEFQSFDHNEANVRNVFDRIEYYQNGERQYSRPSQERQVLKEELKMLMNNERERRLLEQSNNLYHDFLKNFAR